MPPTVIAEQNNDVIPLQSSTSTQQISTAPQQSPTDAQQACTDARRPSISPSFSMAMVFSESSVQSNLFERKYDKITVNSADDAKEVMDHLHQRFRQEKNIFKWMDTEPDDYKTSYSLLVSSEKGFQLALVPFSHLMDSNETHYHRCHVVRLLVPSGCSILFRSRLLHAGSHSRTNKDVEGVETDLRLFAYVHDHPGQNRSTRFLPEVSGDLSYASSTKQCVLMDKPNSKKSSCDYCSTYSVSEKSDGIKIDGNVFEPSRLSYGTPLFGDLKKHGFCMFKSPAMAQTVGKRVNDLFYNKQIYKKFAGSIKAGGKNQQNRVMLFASDADANALYKADKEDIPKAKTRTGKLTDYWKKIIKTVRNITQNPDLVLHKPNIIGNVGEIPVDQTFHFDYSV